VSGQDETPADTAGQDETPADTVQAGQDETPAVTVQAGLAAASGSAGGPGEDEGLNHGIRVDFRDLPAGCA
jgi:hypothetical protein